MEQVTTARPAPRPRPEGPAYASLRRNAQVLLWSGCALAAAAGAFALSAFAAKSIGARLSWSGPITLLLLAGMLAGWGLARVRHKPFFQNLGVVWAIALPIALLLAIASGVGTYATALVAAAFAAYGCEARVPWGPNLLLVIPLAPAVVHATFFVAEGGLLPDALEAAVLATVALLAYETARLGEGFGESWQDLEDGEGADAVTRATGGETLALSLLGATLLVGVLATLIVGLLYWKDATLGRTGLGDTLGDPSTLVPVLLAVLALALVGLLALQRGSDEGPR